MVPFNLANLNAYLTSIGSDVPAINQFAAELSANFLTALQARFILTPPQVTYVNNMKLHERLGLTSTLNTTAALASLPNTELPVEFDVYDIDNPPIALAGDPYLYATMKIKQDLITGKTGLKPEIGIKIPCFQP